MILRPFFFAFLLLGCADIERDNPQDPSNVDGKVYSTAVINGKLWMHENLNHKVSGSKCYPTNCEWGCNNNVYSDDCKGGRLYSYGMAKDVCPGTWRLPTADEMNALPSSFFNQGTGYYITKEDRFDGSGFNSFWLSDGEIYSVYGSKRQFIGSGYYVNVRCVKNLKEVL
jgi:hypothetical protein